MAYPTKLAGQRILASVVVPSNARVVRGMLARSAFGLMPWSSSTRRQRLPKDWARTTRRILDRDGHRCYVCGGRATEVDHVRNGDDHRDANLAAICRGCHRRKSSAEGNQAQGHGSLRKRPTGEHPGRRGGGA